MRIPKAYEQMRDRFLRQGLSKKRAQERAARIYNSIKRPSLKPVGRKKH